MSHALQAPVPVMQALQCGPAAAEQHTPAEHRPLSHWELEEQVAPVVLTTHEDPKRL